MNLEDPDQTEYRLSMRLPAEIHFSLLEIEEYTLKKRSEVVLEALVFYLTLKSDVMTDFRRNIFKWLESPEGLEFLRTYWKTYLDKILEEKIDQKIEEKIRNRIEIKLIEEYK